MASLEGRVARPERWWGCCRGPPCCANSNLHDVRHMPVDKKYAL